LEAFVIAFFRNSTHTGATPCDGDETGIDDEGVVDAVDGVKTRLDFQQRFANVSAILVAFDRHEGAQRHPGYQGSSILSYSKPAAVSSDCAKSNMLFSSGARTEKGPSVDGFRPSCTNENKKADVAEHPKVLDHVGLLSNQPPGTAGLFFI
jgi:hypothetical protein